MRRSQRPGGAGGSAGGARSAAAGGRCNVQRPRAPHRAQRAQLRGRAERRDAEAGAGWSDDGHAGRWRMCGEPGMKAPEGKPKPQPANPKSLRNQAPNPEPHALNTPAVGLLQPLHPPRPPASVRPPPRPPPPPRRGSSSALGSSASSRPAARPERPLQPLSDPPLCSCHLRAGAAGSPHCPPPSLSQGPSPRPQTASPRLRARRPLQLVSLCLISLPWHYIILYFILR